MAPSQHDWKIVYRDVKQQQNKTKRLIKYNERILHNRNFRILFQWWNVRISPWLLKLFVIITCSIENGQFCCLIRWIIIHCIKAIYICRLIDIQELWSTLQMVWAASSKHGSIIQHCFQYGTIELSQRTGIGIFYPEGQESLPYV